MNPCGKGPWLSKDLNKYSKGIRYKTELNNFHWIKSMEFIFHDIHVFCVKYECRMRVVTHISKKSIHTSVATLVNTNSRMKL